MTLEEKKLYQKKYRENPANKARRNLLNQDPKRKIKKKAYRMKRVHNLSHEKYLTMLQEQGYLCPICFTDHSTLRNGLVIDHDHKTGKIRGLLCNSCNVALGLFKDNTSYLKGAISYLKQHHDAIT